MSFDPESALEELAEELARPGAPLPTAEELVTGFLARTPRLTFTERAALLGEALGAVEAAATAAPRPSAGRPAGGTARAPGGAARPTSAPGAPGGARAPARSAGGAARPGSPARTSGGGGFNWGRLGSALRTGLDLFSQGAQIVSQFTPPPAAPAAGPAYPAPAPGAYAAPYAAEPMAAAPAGAGAGPLPQQLAGLAGLLQALQSGQIPALPSPSPAPPPAAAPGLAPATAAAQPGPTMDATAMLGLLLGNPRLQQALQVATVLGPAAPRTVALPIPTSTAGQARTVEIPLGAVVSALRGLAGEALAELNAATAADGEAVPGYLLGPAGEQVVDVASPEERAALVVHLFRLSHEGERAGELAGERDGFARPGSHAAVDEAERWAREAGWTT